MAHTMGDGKQLFYIEYPVGGVEGFLVFVGDYYYPLGGWQDFLGVFTSAEEAQVAVEDAIEEHFGWGHVIDLKRSWGWACVTRKDAEGFEWDSSKLMRYSRQ